jgi:hypothetical protein
VMWQDGNSTDGGRSWSSTWIMEFTRRELLYQGPLLNGPSVTNLRCSAEQHRGLDFLLGEWAGMSPETASEDQGEEVRAQIHPILEGCAVMERVQAVGQSSAWEVFRVRTFEPARQQWVEYRLDTRHPVIQRLEAEPPAAGSLTQTSDGGLSWTEERWNEEGAQWQLQPGVRYRERLGSVAMGG